MVVVMETVNSTSVANSNVASASLIGIGSRFWSRCGFIWSSGRCGGGGGGGVVAFPLSGGGVCPRGSAVGALSIQLRVHSGRPGKEIRLRCHTWLMSLGSSTPSLTPPHSPFRSPPSLWLNI